MRNNKKEAVSKRRISNTESRRHREKNIISQQNKISVPLCLSVRPDVSSGRIVYQNLRFAHSWI